MNYWIESVKERLNCIMEPPRDKVHRYFGNGIINPFVKSAPVNEIKILDRRLVMPELNSSPETFRLKQHSKAYQLFYFFGHKHLVDLDADFLMLHNSWAPDIFKVAGFNELMYFDCTLANILFEVLEIDRSHIKDFLFFEQD